MRMDQFAGLPPAAEKFLEINRWPPKTCEVCGHITGSYIAKCGTFPGGWGNEYPLHRYLLEDGKAAEEFLQIAPWSSGPVHFLGLRLEDETEFTWTDKEIEVWL